MALEPREVSIMAEESKRVYHLWAYYGKGALYESSQRINEVEAIDKRHKKELEKTRKRSNPIRHYFPLRKWMIDEAIAREDAKYCCLNINDLLEEYFQLMKNTSTQKPDFKSPAGVVRYLLGNNLPNGTPHITDLDDLLKIIEGNVPIFDEYDTNWILEEQAQITRFYHDPRIWRYPELGNKVLEKELQSLGFEITGRTVRRRYQVRYFLRHRQKSS